MVAAGTDRTPAATCVLCDGRERQHLFRKDGWAFVRCRGCELISIDPLPSEAELAAVYEDSYRDGAYADFAAAEPVRAAIARDRFDRVRPLASSGPWLDVGCATGAFVAEVQRAGLAVEGIEVAGPAVEEARARGLPVRVVAVESYRPDAPCAVVTAFDLIEHLADPLGFGRRVHDWMLPGGLFALTLPDVGSLTARVLGRHWFYYKAPFHVHYFTASTIRGLLERAGFRAVEVSSVRKPLPLGYATEQLRSLAPAFAPVAGWLTSVLPTAWRERPIPVPVGEMLVTARAV